MWISYLLHKASCFDIRTTISKMIEDFAFHDILLSDSFPKEINKGKIKDIFEILQSQERLDLSQELKNLLLLKTIWKLMNKNIKSWKSSSTCFCDLFWKVLWSKRKWNSCTKVVLNQDISHFHLVTVLYGCKYLTFKY